MELIKLLDLANPKLIKDTLNKLSQDYETFRTEIEETANAALNTAVTANDTANTALATVTDYEAVVMESAQDSSSARSVAEEALAMITQADERSQEAALLAEQAFTEASEAVQTSELAMNVANEAKSTIDQALDVGSLGSFVHNVHGIALAHAHMTDNPNQADDEELSYIATPTLVREAIKDKADLTNGLQTIEAKKIMIRSSDFRPGYPATYPTLYMQYTENGENVNFYIQHSPMGGYEARVANAPSGGDVSDGNQRFAFWNGNSTKIEIHQQASDEGIIDVRTWRTNFDSLVTVEQTLTVKDDLVLGDLLYLGGYGGACMYYVANQNSAAIASSLRVRDNLNVGNDATISGDTHVYGNFVVDKDVTISGKLYIS